MAALGESSIPNWANENEDGTTLRTIVNFELKIIALLFPNIKSKYLDNPMVKTTNKP